MKKYKRFDIFCSIIIIATIIFFFTDNRYVQIDWNGNIFLILLGIIVMIFGGTLSGMFIIVGFIIIYKFMEWIDPDK